MYLRDDTDDDDDEVIDATAAASGMRCWGTITRTADSVLPDIASTDLLLTYRHTRDTQTTLIHSYTGWLKTHTCQQMLWNCWFLCFCPTKSTLSQHLNFV